LWSFIPHRDSKSFAAATSRAMLFRVRIFFAIVEVFESSLTRMATKGLPHISLWWANLIRNRPRNTLPAQGVFRYQSNTDAGIAGCSPLITVGGAHFWLLISPER
jgi:hypothetical protein